MKLDLHVEVDDTLSLQQAHDLVTTFEQELIAALGEKTEVVSHIEPVGSGESAPPAARNQNDSRVESLVADVVTELCGPGAVHNIHIVTDAAGRVDISLHCYLDGDTPVTQAHQLSDQAEKAIRNRLPELDLGHVVIHVEPV